MIYFVYFLNLLLIQISQWRQNKKMLWDFHQNCHGNLEISGEFFSKVLSTLNVCITCYYHVFVFILNRVKNILLNGLLSIIYHKSYLLMNESTIFKIFFLLERYTKYWICSLDFCSLIPPYFFLELENVKNFYNLI